MTEKHPNTTEYSPRIRASMQQESLAPGRTLPELAMSVHMGNTGASDRLNNHAEIVQLLKDTLAAWQPTNGGDGGRWADFDAAVKHLLEVTIAEDAYYHNLRKDYDAYAT